MVTRAVRAGVMAVPSRLAQQPGPSGETGPARGYSDPAHDRLGDKSRSGTLAVKCLALVTDTRSANRALHVSVTHGRENLRRLPKDKLDRQREGSMWDLLFSIPSFDKADKVTCL